MQEPTLTDTPVGGAPADMETAILAIVCEVLGRSLGVDDDMFDHGATSLSFVRVLAQIGETLGVRLRAADLNGVATASCMAACARAGSPRSVPDCIGA